MSFFTSREGSGMLGRAFMDSNFIQSFFRSFNFCFALLLSIPLLVTNFCSYILTIILSISAKKHNSSVITSNQVTAPSMDATSNPSSSSSSPPSSWDVFLSFYGKDTRAGFISHLYEALDQAGIQTFRDDPALEKGDEISPALFQAIGSSNKFVTVLSENYAYSSWCLDELVEILFCKRTNNQVVVIPVFYYVNPRDVRYHKETFAKAIEYHYQKKRYSGDMIDEWKSALAEIGDLSGYHLKKDAKENESDIIRKIVENVAPQTSTVLDLEKYLFGIDSAVEEIYQKLSMESNDVRAIGICGMGGIGKTTTAKAFFNKYSNKFDICCFIENVKQQYSQGGSHLLSLLKNLLIQLLRRKDYTVPDVEIGIRKLKQILYSKKALIVFDDLDQSELLARLWNLFSTGSIIIITTRDANLLNQLKVDISEVDIYMVKELGEFDSLELFSYHAFRRSIPPDSFKELSQKFVSYAGGLPLALKVLGSSLRGRTHVSFWKAHLEKVRVNPEIHEILKLSYDELVYETEKEIFLDIVFFFVGKDKDEAVHVFNSCGFLPDAGIPTLVERCLLTIDENNKFRMHNVIQDMGMEVIRAESRHGKCRRLYLCQGNAWDALQNSEGTHKIEALVLDLATWTKKHLCVKIFERMPNLRLLEIIGAHNIKDYEGNFRNSFHNLRCMRWPHCPLMYLPSDFRPPQLVFLDMPYSKLKTMWKNIMPLRSLKIINVSYSENLKTTPNFRGIKFVEKLLLRGCKSLVEVHPSIGQLSNLYHLDLGQCNNLKKLCEPIGQLTELGHLDISGCVNMTRLPKSIKQWTNMGFLNMGGCRNLKRLPEQLGDMKGLKMLYASETSIEQLPDSIVELKELVVLDLGRCFKLTSLPNSIWKLKLLEVLHLEGCSKLERLPEQLGKMQSLIKLDASDTAIEEIPDSIGLLSSLQKLNLSRCKKVMYLPKSIWDLRDTTSISLPTEDICRINFPDTVTMMKLEALDMRCNIRLWLPIILSFSSLERLRLTDDEDKSFSSTKPFSLSNLSNLRHLTLYNCTSLGYSFPELPLNLEFLSVSDYATLEQLPDLSSFKQLNYLYISNCNSLQSLAPLPPHLRILEVVECTSLQHVPDLSTLEELNILTITGCSSNLKSVSLKQSFLEGRANFFSSLADLPNREIPEWFHYKSSGCTISLEIPPILGDNFCGLALWFVYKCKTSITHITYPYIRAVIKNRTEGITKNKKIHVNTYKAEAEAQSRIECIRGDKISVKSGDIIKVSFQTFLYSGYDDVVGEVKVEKCGAHVIQKKASTPY